VSDLAPARGNGAIAGFNGRETLQTRLERTAATAPDKGLVFVDRHEHETFISWADVFARGAAVAGGLRALGVGPGDTVAVVAPTGPAFFDAFFGASLAGAVPVPLYPPTRLGRLDEYQARTAAMLTVSVWLAFLVVAWRNAQGGNVNGALTVSLPTEPSSLLIMLAVAGIALPWAARWLRVLR